MKRSGKILLGVVAIVGLGIQLIPGRHDEPQAVTWADFTEVLQAPADVGAMLRASCYDCHSNQTRYPWYSHIQPVSYFMQRHINEGKAEFNFSEFGNLSARMQRLKLNSVIGQIEDGTMPLKSYVLIHRDALLSEDEKQHLLNFLEEYMDSTMK